MTNEAQEPTVGPWAREKLASLRSYLEFYTTVLKKQTWLQSTWFIDAFAGAGMARVRRQSTKATQATSTLFDPASEEAPEPEEVEYIKGSPRVALEITNPFGHYLFIEKLAEHARELESLKAEFPDRSIETRVGDANDELKAFLTRDINWRTNRGVVFLDPFGMQASWSTIEAIARTGGLEVIINLPLQMAINRVLTRSADIPSAWRDRLDAVFGSADWHELAYETRADLLGETVAKRHDAVDRILHWYRGRLRGVFGHVSTAQPVTNTRGRTLYYLIWAGPHAKGLDGADYILGRKTGGQRVSP